MEYLRRLNPIQSSPYLRFFLGLVVSVLCLYLALLNVSIIEVRRAISEVELGFFVLSCGAVIFTVLCKVIRWWILLTSVGQVIPFSRISFSFLSAQMLNAFLPVRVGELNRVAVIGGSGVGHALVLGTIAIEKYLDMVVFAILFSIMLIIMPLPVWLGGSGYIFIGMTVLLSLIVTIIVIKRNSVYWIIERLIKYAPSRLQSYISSHIKLGLSSLDVLQSRSVLLSLAFWSALIWSFALLTNHLVITSFDLKLPLRASLLLLIALQAGISIPSLPAKVGLFEYICVLALGIFGVQQSMAFSYGLLLHVIVYLPIITLGLVSFWLLQLGKH